MDEKVLYGLIGFPLGHSFSASFFNEKFEKEGRKAEYRNFPLEDLEQFEELVKANPSLMGLNVTVPYKQKVIPYLDALNETARKVQAVNTIKFCREGGRLGRIGFNTDVTGFERSLSGHLESRHRKALVLGTGGSSKAVVHVLEKLGIAYSLVSRAGTGIVLSYEELNSSIVGDALLIINTSPLGMHPDVDSAPAIPYESLGDRHLLFDLVYNPAKTLFMKKGEDRGAKAVNGMDMLKYQALAAWDIWNS